MTAKERFLRTLAFEPVDRLPFIDFGYWPETIEAWHSQGLPEDVTTDEAVERYLGLDVGFEQNELNGFDETGEKGMAFRVWPQFEAQVLEETADRVISINGQGVTAEYGKHGSSIPRFIRFPVETMADFERLLPRLDAAHPGRVKPTLAGIVRAAWEGRHEQAVGLWLDGFFAWPRELMGVENLSLAFYDAPELIHAINGQHAGFLIAYADSMIDRCTVDYACFFEDMAYKNGPLASPAVVREFMMPYYEKVVNHLRSRGVNRILIDSDGNTTKIAPLFAEVADGHYPCEINAGNHPELLRQTCPKLALIGGVDKTALIAGRQAIERELAKLPERISMGGYIPAVDHRVPPDVTLDDYRYYLEKKWNIICKI